MKFILLVLGLVTSNAMGQNNTFTWKDFSFGDPPLTVKLPETPKPQEVALPENVLLYIQRYDAYFIKDEDKGIVIAVSHVRYSDDITADIKGAVQGTIGQWKATGATVEVKTNMPGYSAGRQGLQVRGSFNMDGLEHNFAVMAFGEGAKLWLISILVRANDANLQQAMKTMIDSITF